MSFTSTIVGYVMQVLEDPRVEAWIDQRITNALDTQKAEIIASVEGNASTVISALSNDISGVGSSVSSLDKGLTGVGTSIATQVVSAIQSLIPFHLLRRTDL